MAKSRPKKPPKYCHHKATGQAYVHLAGKDWYLGKHGSSESWQKYTVLVAEHSAGAILDAPKLTTGSSITVAELVVKYLKYAESYYVKNGEPTDEVDCIKSAVRPLVPQLGIAIPQVCGFG